jgi:lipopolysaccharide transport system permease protein
MTSAGAGVELSATPTVVIEARPDTLPAVLRALWRYRGFYGLLFKDLLMRRARGTLLGIWWVFLRPLSAAAGYIAAFTVVAPSVTAGSNIPYPVFFLSGFITWRLFAATLQHVPRSLTRSRSIMAKTYFPRLLVPFAGFGLAVIEVGFLLVIFIALAVWTAWNGPTSPVALRWATLWLIPCLLGSLLFALAFGMVLGIIALFFRDIMYSARYFSQLMMLVTPVLYPPEAVPGSFRWLVFALNPMAQMVIVSRWALTGQGQFEAGFVALAFVSILIVFGLAVWFFLRAETQLGDQL